MRRSHMRALLGALILSGSLASAVLGEDIPQWPHEQQARLREIETNLLEVQRKLANARRANDVPAIETLGAEFKSIQKERMALIRATDGQLQSE